MSTVTQGDWDRRYEEGNTPWDSGRPSRELVSVIESGAIPAGRALELGCGTGTNAVYLAQRGFEVTAADLSPLALDRARQRADSAGVKVNWVAADATALPDLVAPFDFL